MLGKSEQLLESERPILCIFLSAMYVLWLTLYCMSWRLGLFVIENVFVQILVQESSSSNMDTSFSNFAIGMGIVKSVLISFIICKGVVSLNICRCLNIALF